MDVSAGDDGSATVGLGVFGNTVDDDSTFGSHNVETLEVGSGPFEFRSCAIASRKDRLFAHQLVPAHQSPHDVVADVWEGLLEAVTRECSWDLFFRACDEVAPSSGLTDWTA